MDVAPEYIPAPTSKPTFVAGEPTPQPSFKPTNNYPVVKIEVVQTVNGLDASDFDTPDKLASNGRMIVLAVMDMINTAIPSGQVNENDVELLSVSSARRRLLSNGVVIKYRVTAGGTGLSASAANAAVQTSLANTAAFASSLQAAYVTVSNAGGYSGSYTGGSLTVIAPVISVISLDTPSPVTSPTAGAEGAAAEGGSGGSGGGGSIGIIIGAAVAGIALLAAGAYYYYYMKKLKAGKYENESLDDKVKPLDVKVKPLDVKVKPLYTAPSSLPSSTQVHPIFEESDIEAGITLFLLLLILLHLHSNFLVSKKSP